MADRAVAMLDLENLFNARNFEPHGEYDRAYVEELDVDDFRAALDEQRYRDYLRITERCPRLIPVPRYADLLNAWLHRRFAVEQRRTFGKKWDPGVRASRERFADLEWGFQPVPDGKDAADRWLLMALAEATGAARFDVYVVGTGDAKPDTGILARAAAMVVQARRVRAGSRLVAVQGPRGTTTRQESRWSDPDDLGQVDEVHLLSRIVFNQLKGLRTRAHREPRAALRRIPRRPVPKHWRITVQQWKAQADAEVAADVVRRLGRRDRGEIERAFDHVDRALRELATEERARLRPLVGAQVNQLLQTAPDPTAGIATFPRPGRPLRAPTPHPSEEPPTPAHSSAPR